MSEELIGIINRSLNVFFSSIFDKGWKGREREAISYYAFDFLQKECHPESVFESPGQIGIETAVPGLPGINSKDNVNKDLVIWRKAGMNVWNSSGQIADDILAIMEWKVIRRSNKIFSVSKKDTRWLRSFINRHKITIGYAIAIDLKKKQFKYIVIQYRDGSITEKLFV